MAQPEVHAEAQAEAQAEIHVEGQQHPIAIYLKIWAWLFVLSAGLLCRRLF